METLDFAQLKSRSDLAHILGISVETLKRWEKEGRAPPRVQISPRVVAYRESDIRDFLAARTIAVA